MTFTFNPSLATPLDRVRQRIGDTNPAPKRAELQDETINAYLAENPSVLAVAYRCALDLAAKYAKIVQVTVDHQTTEGQQIAANYRLMAEGFLAEMRRDGGGATVDLPGLWVTGIGDASGPWDVPTLPPLPC